MTLNCQGTVLVQDSTLRSLLDLIRTVLIVTKLYGVVTFTSIRGPAQVSVLLTEKT